MADDYTPTGEVLDAARRLIPRRGSGIDSITISTDKGGSVTIPAIDRPANDAVPVPSDVSFGDNDFQEAPDLQALASQLLTKHDISFRHIRSLRIAFLWKRKGGKKGEKGIWGKVSQVSGVAQYWGGVEYVVWLAADHCRKNHLGTRQIEALLYHEFCHFGQDPDTGEIKMVGHDAEVFAQEVREYGLWTVDLEPVADAFRQLPLTPFEE